VAIAEGLTLGLVFGEGVFEATGGISSGVEGDVDTSIFGFTVGEDAGVEIGDDAGVEIGDDAEDSIDRDSLWVGVQRESINMDRTTNTRMTIRVFL
jgi:hypothetical protein